MKAKSKFTDNERRIIMGELIGEEITVKRSSQRNLVGMRGRIIDETLKMLTIDRGEKEIRIPKKDCVFEFRVSGKSVEIDGRKLMYRPEDRIKKHWRKYNGKM